MKDIIKTFWFGTRTLRIPFGKNVYVFTKPLEFGEGTATEDLWNAGYSVHLGHLLGLRFLVFEEPVQKKGNL